MSIIVKILNSLLFVKKIRKNIITLKESAVSPVVGAILITRIIILEFWNYLLYPKLRMTTSSFIRMCGSCPFQEWLILSLRSHSTKSLKRRVRLIYFIIYEYYLLILFINGVSGSLRLGYIKKSS